MKSNNDISPFIALTVLLLVSLGMLGLSNYEYITLNWKFIYQSIQYSQKALLYLAISLFFNFYIVCMVVERSLGFKKQGSKLRSIKKEQLSLKELMLKASLSLLIVTPFYNTNFNFIKDNTLSLKPILNQYYSLLVEVGSYSTWFSLLLFGFGVVGFLGIIFNILSQGGRLPSFKQVENHLTLGSIGEERNSFEKEINPRWALIPQKALNGNILVTGSIGTGKTQGTILNFAEQLLGNNFHLTPSSLVLDPKGSFIPEIINILKKRNALGSCVYLGDAHGNI